MSTIIDDLVVETLTDLRKNKPQKRGSWDRRVERKRPLYDLQMKFIKVMVRLCSETLTIDDVAKEMGVSVRTAYRYMECLKDSNIVTYEVVTYALPVKRRGRSFKHVYTIAKENNPFVKNYQA